MNGRSQNFQILYGNQVHKVGFWKWALSVRYIPNGTEFDTILGSQ